MLYQSTNHLHLHNNLHRRPRPKRAARPLRNLNRNLNSSPNLSLNPSFRPSHHRNRNRRRRRNPNPSHSHSHSHSHYSPSSPHAQPQRQPSLVRLRPRAQRLRNLPRSKRRIGRRPLAMGQWALRHQLQRPCNLHASLHLSIRARTTTPCRVRRPNHRIRLLRPMSPPMV